MSDLKAYSVKEAAGVPVGEFHPLQCFSAKDLGAMWGCPPHHIIELWKRGEIPAISLTKTCRPSNLIFKYTSVADKRHLAFGDFPPAPPPTKPKKPRELPELTRAILECAKTKPTYWPEEGKAHRIYFVQCGDFVKIGYATNVIERMKGLRGMTPYPLTLLKVIEGMIAGERAIHAHLGHYHHAYEWFRLEPDLAKAINALPGKRVRHV